MSEVVENNGRVIVEAETEWRVIGAGKRCLVCEHVHYPRRPLPNPREIEQWWGWCEEPSCSCRRLHCSYMPNGIAGRH